MKLRIWLLILLFSFNLSYADTKNKLGDVTILVPSCDKYSSLWNPFFTLLFKHWPSLNTYNKDVPILLISNNERYNDNRITPINIPNEKSWSNNVLQALHRVKTRYVLILLEDYIVQADVKEDLLLKQFNFFKNNDGGFLQLFGVNRQTQSFSKIYDEYNMELFDKHSKYRTSLQAGIWDKRVLQWLIKDEESAWDFEIAGSFRSEGNKQPFYISNVNTIDYLNAAHSSVLSGDVLDYIEKQGITMTPTLITDRQFKGKWKFFKHDVKHKIYWSVIKPIKNFIVPIIS